MYSKRNNIEIMTSEKADKVNKELFELLLSRYEIGLETSMKGTDLIFDSFIYCTANDIK